MSSPSLGGARAEQLGGGGVVQSVIAGQVGQISLSARTQRFSSNQPINGILIPTLFSSWYHN